MKRHGIECSVSPERATTVVGRVTPRVWLLDVGA